MASTTSFKQQCPSCEAMVPIRDPKLVGRKIDCPKCKYRFVVEKPGASEDEEDEDDTPAPSKKVKKPSAAVKAGKPAAKGASKAAGVAKGKPAPRRRDEDEDEGEHDERPKKKKSGVSMTVMLGGGLGVLALVLLIAGAVVMLGSGSKDSKSNPTKPGGSTGTTPPVVDNGQDKKPDGPTLTMADISNLLPNDSEAVVNLQIDKLYGSGLRHAALGTAGAFNENAFKSVFGFPLYDANTGEGVQRVVTALNNSNHWVFTVLRTLKSVNQEQLVANLELDPLPAVNGLTPYSVKRDLDSLSNLLVKANRGHEDLQLCILDARTLVFADPAPMQTFLAAKGKPVQRSQPTAAGPPGGFTPPGGSMPPGGSSMPPPGGSSMPPPGGSMPPLTSSSTPPGGSMPPLTSSSTPPGGSSMPPGGSTSGGSSMPGGSSTPGASAPPPPPPAVFGSYLTIDPVMKALFDKLEKSGPPALFSIVLSANDPMLDEMDRYSKDDPTVSRAMRVAKIDNALLRGVVDKLKDAKLHDLGVVWVGATLTAFSQTGIGGALALGMTDDNMAKGYLPMGQEGVGLINNLLGGASGGMGVPGFTPPGGSSVPGGSSTPAGSTGPAMPMTTPPYTPPSGSSTPGGSMPPPGGSTTPGSNPMNGGNPSGAQGPFSLIADGNTLVLTGAVQFSNDQAFQAVEQPVAQVMVHLKGQADMLSTRSRVHDLAAALQKYLKDKGHFPRGTADRPLTADRFIDWAPNQRVSWMAELLPYLGDGEYAGLTVDPNKSWQEGSNLSVAGVLVSPFIGRSAMPTPPVVRYPGVPQPVATTSFVGVAGVGMDAAEYPLGHPKAGAFGYDRETKPADVKDGLEKTIVLLQVPPDLKDPWLAGGGATVRGVSEGPDAVRPFVCVEYQGKRGTFAVMGDGKVRFIPETMDPNLFRALCTVAGGEKIDDLDKIAPVVPGGQTELKAEAPAGPPPAGPPPPPDPKPNEKGSATGKVLNVPEEGFSAWFPADPKASDKSVLHAPEGEGSIRQWKAEMPNGGGTFEVVSAEVPPKVAERGEEKAGQWALSILGSDMGYGIPLTVTKTNIGGHTGAETIYSVEKSSDLVRLTNVVVNNHAYQLQVRMPESKINSEPVQTFISSFKLTAK